MQRGVHLDAPQADAGGYPAIVDHPPTGAHIANLIDAALDTTLPPHRQALAWQMCCRITETMQAHADPGGALVERADAYISANIAQTLSAKVIADAVGVSQNTLLRWIRRRHDQSIAGRVIHLRVKRAVELLRTTDLTIGAVAAEVGMPDRQHFNKTVRRLLGVAPRALRTPMTGLTTSE